MPPKNLEHELANALKTAGYPQAMREGDACYLNASETPVVAQTEIQGNALVYIFYRNTVEHRVHSAADAWIKKPTLSELIEVCENVKGYHLFCLEHPREGWLATMADDSASAPLETYASGGYQATPEKAVAHLWLALQAATGAQRHEKQSNRRRSLSTARGARWVGSS